MKSIIPIHNKIMCLCSLNNDSSRINRLFFVRCQRYVKVRYKTSEMIRMTRVMMDARPMTAAEARDLRPKIKIPSRIPSPVGVRMERYPANNENTKKPTNSHMSCGLIGKMLPITKKYPSPKKR